MTNKGQKHIILTLKNHLKSLRFYVSVLIFSIFLILKTKEERTLNLSVGINYFFDTIYRLTDTDLILVLLSSFPVITIFVDDWKSGRILQILTRCSKRDYITEIITVSAAVSFFVTFVSNIIFMVYLSFSFRLFNEHNTINVTEVQPLGQSLLKAGNPLYYLLVFFMISALYCTFTVISVVISIALTDNYISFILPAISYIFNYRFLNNYPPLFFVQPDRIFTLNRVFTGGVKHYLKIELPQTMDLIYAIIFLLVYVKICSNIGYYLLDKKIKKETSFGGGLSSE